MSKRIEKLLYGMTAFIDGTNYIGRAVKFKPDEPTPRTKESSSPGNAGKFERLTRKYNASTPTVALADYVPEVMGMVGNPKSVDKVLRVVGGIGSGEDLKRVEYEISGVWTKTETDEWADDSETMMSFSVSARQYRVSIDGVETLFIDYELGTVRLNGEDINSDLTSILGS